MPIYTHQVRNVNKPFGSKNIDYAFLACDIPDIEYAGSSFNALLFNVVIRTYNMNLGLTFGIYPDNNVILGCGGDDVYLRHSRVKSCPAVLTIDILMY